MNATNAALLPTHDPTGIGPALLTLEQAADTLQVDRVTLWRWSLTGRFPVPVLRLGRARRVRAAELAAWISAGCPAGRDRWTWTGK